MRAAAVAVAGGFALALYGIALQNALAAQVWPQIALGVLLLGFVGGGVAALAVMLAPASLLERVRRLAAELLGLAAALALAALAVLPRVAAGLKPGPALDLAALPAFFLASAVVPCALAAAVVSVWLSGGGHRRGGWLLVGAGAGWLAAAALTGSDLPVRTPSFGGPVLEFTPAGGGAWTLGIDRGLRADLVAPTSPIRLPFLPPPGVDGRADALLVGFPNGPVLAALLGMPDVHVTILEEDATLIAAVLRHWPALETARVAGRVVFVVGNPRWSLERTGVRYGLIALAQGGSPSAYLSRALNLRADHRWTLEAFRSYLAHLAPNGYLLVERTATGRVVATLREASGLAAADFLHKLVILGEPGHLSSQCWYSPAGLSDRTSRRAAVGAAAGNGMQVLYIPSKRPTGTFYDRLITEDPVKGHYFSTPLDLSPTLDERPFFDDVDRLLISPTGRSMPEEPEPLEKPARLSPVPPGDRGVVGVLLFGAAAALAILAAARRGGRAHEGAVCVSRAAAPALALGACAALSLESFAAWARWLAPSPAAAQAALAAALLAAGSGWLRARGRNLTAGLLILAAALSVAAFAAYRAAPAVPLLGRAGSALAVAAGGALLGLLLGWALSAGAIELEARLPGSSAGVAGPLLCAAPLAWSAGAVAATHFGYPVLWALAAVAALAALRDIRRLPRG